MRAPHAPVEAGAANRPARLHWSARLDADRGKMRSPRLAKLDGVAVADHEFPRKKPVEHFYGMFAGQMIVTDARLAHRRLARSGPGPPGAERGGNAHDRFQHASYLRTGQPVIAVASL